MPKCPHCEFETKIISAFCPACGGPMHIEKPLDAPAPDAPAPMLQMDEPQPSPAPQPVIRPASSLGMGWLRFLVMFVLPMNIISGIISLFDLNLPDFIKTLQSPEVSSLLSDPEKLMVYASLILSVIQVPLLIFSLVNLFRQRWSGVQALLINYLINAGVAVVFVLILYAQPAPDVAGYQESLSMLITQMAASAIGMIIMFFINRVYFNKRRGFFLPEKM